METVQRLAGPVFQLLLQVAGQGARGALVRAKFKTAWFQMHKMDVIFQRHAQDGRVVLCRQRDNIFQIAYLRRGHAFRLRLRRAHGGTLRHRRAR